MIFLIHPAFTNELITEPVQITHSDDALEKLKFLITNSDQTDDLASNLASNLAEKMFSLLMKLNEKDCGKEELLQEINISNQTKNVRRYIEPLEKIALIEKTIPDKPTSPNQKYRLTSKGRELLFRK